MGGDPDGESMSEKGDDAVRNVYRGDAHAPVIQARDIELKEHVAHNLIRCREAAGISQEELSYRASLNRTEISLLERGQRMPRIDTAVRVAGSLGVPLDELVVGIKWEPGYVIVKVGE